MNTLVLSGSIGQAETISLEVRVVRKTIPLILI